MIGATIALVLTAQGGPVGDDSKPWPPCRDGAEKCAPWYRDWGHREDHDFTPVIWNEDQTWSIQTKAIANANLRQRPRAWVKFDYSPSKVRKEKQILTLYVFDCSNERFAVLHRVSRSASGATLENEEFHSFESDFRFIVPDTYVAKIAALLCPA